MNYISSIYNGIKNTTYQIAEKATSTASHVARHTLLAISDYFAPNAVDWCEREMRILALTWTPLFLSFMVTDIRGFSSYAEFLSKVQEAFPAWILGMFITTNVFRDSLNIFRDNREMVETLITTTVSYLILMSDTDISIIGLAGTLPCGIQAATVIARAVRAMLQAPNLPAHFVASLPT